MKRPKLLILTLLLLPIIAFGVFRPMQSQRAPGEAEMLANFKTHKAIFCQLAQMANADNLQDVSASGGTYYSMTVANPDHGLDLSDKRVQQYAALMRQIGVTRMQVRSGAPLRFQIAGGGRGLFRDWSLGLAWAPWYETPAPLVASVFRSPPKPPPANLLFYLENLTYSKIEPNWYFYRSES